MKKTFPDTHDDGPLTSAVGMAGFPQGMVSSFYLTLRCSEEAYRAHRYGRPLALLLVEAKSGPVSVQLEKRLQSWLRGNMRATDVGAYLGEGRYALLLPETDEAGARGLEARLRSEFPAVRASIRLHPWDNLEDLLKPGHAAAEDAA